MIRDPRREGIERNRIPKCRKSENRRHSGVEKDIRRGGSGGENHVMTLSGVRAPLNGRFPRRAHRRVPGFVHSRIETEKFPEYLRQNLRRRFRVSQKQVLRREFPGGT